MQSTGGPTKNEWYRKADDKERAEVEQSIKASSGANAEVHHGDDERNDKEVNETTIVG